jgi:signal transduction histidine kinase
MRKAHPTQTGRTILVVDDQEDSLTSVQRLLERQGHHVVTANGGEDALAVLKNQPVQVALVDYAMPRMSGADLIREIRKRDPLLQIILHTGQCSRYTAHTLLKDLGIQGFHDKSEGPDKLLLWIQAALKHRGAVEELQRQERAHQDLIAHTSHEIKNPLHIICGYGDVLLSGAAGRLSEQAEGVLQIINGKAHGLSDLTSNILLHSKLQANRLDVMARDVELERLLCGLPDLMQLLLAGKNVGFTLDAEDPALTMTTDDGKVEIILHNLLSNAAKFTQQGSVYLRVAALGPELQFVVRDTGIGIATEHLDDVFQPFWQANQSSCQDSGGIGLGLAVSHRLATLLGGNLQVTSELGAGSNFTLTLPIEPELHFTPHMRRPATIPVTTRAEIKTSRSPFGFFRPF